MGVRVLLAVRQSVGVDVADAGAAVMVVDGEVPAEAEAVPLLVSVGVGV